MEVKTHAFVVKFRGQSIQMLIPLTCTICQLRERIGHQLNVLVRAVTGLKAKTSKPPIKLSDDLRLSDCDLSNPQVLGVVGSDKQAADEAKTRDLKLAQEISDETEEEDEHDKILERQAAEIRKIEQGVAEYRSKHVIQFGRRFIGVMKGSDLTYWMEEKCLSGIVEDVDMLLSMDKMEADDDSKARIHQAAEYAVLNCRIEVLCLLFGKKVIRDSWLPALIGKAAEYGRLPVLALFPSVVQVVPFDWGDALGIALKFGHLSVAKWLFKNGAKIPDVALRSVAAKHFLRSCKWLLSRGVRVTLEALKAATVREHLPVMVLLCQAVPDKTVVDAALLFAVAKNKIAAAQCLIQQCKANVDVDQGKALVLACQYGSVEMIQLIIQSILAKRHDDGMIASLSGTAAVRRLFLDLVTDSSKCALLSLDEDAALFVKKDDADGALSLSLDDVADNDGDDNDMQIDRVDNKDAKKREDDVGPNALLKLRECIHAVSHRSDDDVYNEERNEYEDQEDMDWSISRDERKALRYRQRVNILEYLLLVGFAEVIDLSALRVEGREIIKLALTQMEDSEQVAEFAATRVADALRGVIKLSRDVVRVVLGYFLGTEGRNLQRFRRDKARILQTEPVSKEDEKKERTDSTALGSASVSVLASATALAPASASVSGLGSASESMTEIRAGASASAPSASNPEDAMVIVDDEKESQTREGKESKEPDVDVKQDGCSPDVRSDKKSAPTSAQGTETQAEIGSFESEQIAESARRFHEERLKLKKRKMETASKSVDRSESPEDMDTEE